MKFDEYQEATEETATYPEDKALEYLSLGLAGESGEVAEKVKKYLREDDPSYLEQLDRELGDVLWYLAQLAKERGIDLGDVAERNLDKLLDRKDRGKVHGQGDDR